MPTKYLTLLRHNLLFICLIAVMGTVFATTQFNAPQNTVIENPETVAAAH